MNAMFAWFARNRVAANLLMLMILVAGFLAVLFGVRREIFPQISLDMITVTVPYPGATPLEVEEGILLPIEEAVADLDGIDTLDATASEGAGTVVIEVRSDYDTRELMSDVKSRVDGITTFPDDAEEPVIEELVLKMHVITLALASESADELALRHLAEQVRDDLLTIPGITRVPLGGARNYEIGIHVSEEDLRRYGMTFDEVAGAVRASSLNLPAGSIRSGSGDIRIRTQSQAYNQRQFENLVVRTDPDGTRVRVRDVAEVVDGFEEDERWTRFNGHPAVMLNVLAPSRENLPEVVARVHEYVEEKRAELPAGVTLDTWFDFSRFYTERQELMVRNGLQGLALVFVCLALFLNLRLALWVALGVAVSFVGTFAVLWYIDQSINMVSMAAFILVLGIVVDDAIVVAESIHQRHSEGLPGEEGAVAGVTRVATPVIFAVVTSVIAFLPMFAISGPDGKIWGVIPSVIVSCLLLSLVESMLILPAHLSHEAPPRRIAWYLWPIWPVVWLLQRAPVAVDRHLRRFIDHVYRPALETTLRWRYMTVATFVATLILVVGMVAGGRIRASFFPRLAGDVAVASLEMPHGTSAEPTRRVLERIEAAALKLREEVDGDPTQPRAVKHVVVSMGGHPIGDTKNHQPGGKSTGASHLAEAAIEFDNLHARGLSSQKLADRWRDLVGTVPGVRRLTFDATEGNDNKDIHIRLTSDNLSDVEAATAELKKALAGFAGVYEISDTLGSRQQEITLAIRPEAEPLGLRSQDLARQVRQAFYGEEAQRIQRGRDDIRVMVRYPLSGRRSIADLRNMRIRTPQGSEVPLGEVAEIAFGEGSATIRRSDRKRIADVTALLQRDVVDNPDGIMEELQAGFLASLPDRYSGMKWTPEGGMKDQKRVLTELGIGFGVAMFGMYALMAIAFKSYLQPLVIASAIPFGFVGAVLGHVITGQTFSIISFLGLVALAGVVVNDNLVLIDTANRMIREGKAVGDAVREACPQRFRAILLTSVTTFLGLTPLMLETSLQAKFIVPMAVALAFGVAFATLITLSLVPCLLLILEDLRWIPRGAFSSGGARLDRQDGGGQDEPGPDDESVPAWHPADETWSGRHPTETISTETISELACPHGQRQGRAAPTHT